MRVYGTKFRLAVVLLSSLALAGCGTKQEGAGDDGSGGDGLKVERLTEDGQGVSPVPLSSLTAPPPPTPVPPLAVSQAGSMQVAAPAAKNLSAAVLPADVPQTLQARLAASEAEAQRLRGELARLRGFQSTSVPGRPPASSPHTLAGATMPDGRPIPQPKILSAAEAAIQDKNMAATQSSPPAAAAPGTPGDPVQQALASMAPAGQTAGTATGTVSAAPPLSSGSLSIQPMPVPTVNTADSPATSAAGSPAQTLPAVKPSTEQAAYKQALDTYEKKRFAESEAQFDQFLQAYPQSKLAPNALYWKAECLYSRGRFADAVFIFKDVVTRFPKHPKASDALLKAIMSYKRLGDADNANLHYSVLAEDYPTSTSLRRAREMGFGS